MIDKQAAAMMAEKLAATAQRQEFEKKFGASFEEWTPEQQRQVVAVMEMGALLLEGNVTMVSKHVNFAKVPIRNFLRSAAESARARGMEPPPLDDEIPYGPYECKLDTAEGGMEWVKDMMKNCHREFAENGEVRPVVLIAGRRNPETGERLPDIQLVVVMTHMMSTDAHKDGYAGVIRKLAVDFEACALLFITEAWTLLGSTKSEEDNKAFDAYKAGGSLEHVPGRKEIVMITYEHCTARTPQIFSAIIDRSGEKPVLGEFRDMYDDPESGLKGKPSLQGRFTHMMLPRLDKLN